ncbi:MAG TPA: hypothetical protein VJ904_01250, partial [Tichowtungia sp.]|nr:hypothetical protein [Tichowtungia sp.]
SGGLEDGNAFFMYDSGTKTLSVVPDPSMAPPQSPTGLLATPGNAKVTLNWSDSGADVASYSVYRATVPGQYVVALATGLSTSAFTDNTVQNSNTYYYAVSAVGTNGIESGLSFEVSATPTGTATTGYQTWADANGMGAASEDDDGDGLINLYEYGLGGDSGTEPTLPVFTKTETGFTYVYPELADPAAGITYTVQSTTNLITGPWVDLTPSGTVPGDPLNTVTVIVNTAEDGKFVRLKIEQ